VDYFSLSNSFELSCLRVDSEQELRAICRLTKICLAATFSVPDGQSALTDVAGTGAQTGGAPEISSPNEEGLSGYECGKE
jgi:hypothetical protein